MKHHIKYNLGNMPNSKMFSIYVWACDNVKLEDTNIQLLHHEHQHGWTEISFDHDEDAVAFKLRWI